MNHQDILVQIKARGTGKSSLLQKGVENYDRPFALVCRTMEEGRRLTNDNPNAIYITSNTSNIRGSRLPIIFDQEVVADYLDEIEKLHNRLNLLNFLNNAKD